MARCQEVKMDGSACLSRRRLLRPGAFKGCCYGTACVILRHARQFTDAVERLQRR
jgi:hypothetical protein